eukprot:GHVO01042896.1.p1 GENE.GHVO01042896.1~~GHVO01042896.1.p1  ORF type:complete len:370 (-),score=70.17 GHVO01042896.1:121-1200(-)
METPSDVQSTVASPEEISRVTKFAHEMPKTELHIHVDGSIRPEVVIDIAKRNNVMDILPFKTAEEGLAMYNFSNLTEFITLLDTCLLVMRKKQDFYEYTMDYLTKAHEDNVKHVEMQFAPQVVHENCDPKDMWDGIKSAANDAQKKYGMSCLLILTVIRTFSTESAEKMMDLVATWAEDAIDGIGLAGCEVGFPASNFKTTFEYAKKVFGSDIKFVMHAGEEGGIEYVNDALDLGAHRIDHGVSVAKCDKLLQRCLDNKIPLAMCPLSNLYLKVVKSVEEHPIHDMLKKGVLVSISSDDPPFFGGYVNANYEATIKAHNMCLEDVYMLGKNSITGSFASEQRKQELHGELEKCYLKYKA